MKSAYLLSGVAATAILLLHAGTAPAQDAPTASSQAPSTANQVAASPASDSSTTPNSAPTAPASAALGDIVVTARKTAENLQRAPAAIVSVSGDTLLQQSITNPLQLEKVLPSANLHEEGAVTQTFIRGVGSRSDTPNFAAASTFLFNGIVIPRYGTTGLLFDLGTVQAIAGPQGTLYGGSAAGGAINLNSASPHSDFDGNAVLEGGNYGTFHGGGAQDLALGQSLSVRGAVDYLRHDAYYNNGSKSDGINSQDRLAGRVSARFAPSDGFTALVFATGAREHGKPEASLVDNPPGHDPWQLPVTGPDGNPIDASATNQNNRTYVVGANIDWHIGDNSFTYIPGFVHLHDDYTQFIGGYNLLGVHDLENQHSEELRWNRKFGPLKLSLGGFYLRDRTVFSDDIGLALIPAPPYYVFVPINRTRQTNTSYAFFGQAVYSVSDRLRLTGGIRRTRDKIVASGVGGSGPFDFQLAKSRIDWKGGIDFDLAPRVLVYANVQTGYIPFGYNPDVTPSVVVPTSRLLAYSGGLKSRFLDNQLELNDEVFYYDYRHFQAIDFVSLTGQSTVLNADKGTIYGNDLSLRALLDTNTQFDASVVLLHTRFNSFHGVGYNYDGNKFADAPPVNIILGMQHSIVLPTGKLMGRVSSHFESGHYGEFTNNPGTRQRAYTKTDLSLTYTPDTGGWSIAAYVNNVENSAVFGTIATVDSPEHGAGPLAPPRTFGARVTAKW